MDDDKPKKHSDEIDEVTQDSLFEQNEFGETVLGLSTEGAQASSEKSAIKTPESVGRYEIQDILGKGGFGAVYLGYDASLDRRVAVKVPLLKIPEEQKQSFLKEARQLAQLKHPGIVTVHDVGVSDGAFFIVSEYLDGHDLNHWLGQRTITWQEAAEIVATIADALATAHARGIIHRDVKPANIIMTERGEGVVPVLVDFGLAVSEATAGGVSDRGKIAGTPNYMSPEQAQGAGHRIDGRTDIYALGVILYRLLSGRLPFTGASVTDLLSAVISDEVQPPRQFVRGLPRELERICLKAMAKQIADRYTTAGDLGEDLRNLIHEHENKVEPTPAAVRPHRERVANREATKILIADDHELSRFKLQNDLEKWGHEVTVAEDGEQAWELFQKHQFSIVITDWMMPRLDGLQLVQMIRSSERADYVYIIMLTAKSEKHDIVAGMGAGADDFLVKPFHRDELQVRLRAGIRITNLNRTLNDTNQRLQNSQEAAAQIQQSFLPVVRPKCSGFRFAWEHHPSGKPGGDMFNVVTLDEDHLGLYILDVTGDGVPAALLATSLFRVLSPTADPASLLIDRDTDESATRIRTPTEVLDQLQEQFGTQEVRQFFTIVYGVLSISTREFLFANAGHPPLLHIQSDRSPVMLDIDSFPIGISSDPVCFVQKSVTLQPTDRLLLYSDGLPDTINHDGEVFGAARMLNAVRASADEALDTQVSFLIRKSKSWGGATECKDDVSVVAVESK